MLLHSVSLLPKEWNKSQTFWCPLNLYWEPKVLRLHSISFCENLVSSPTSWHWLDDLWPQCIFFTGGAPSISPPLLNCLFATPWTKGHFISLCDRNPSLPLPFSQDAAFHLRSEVTSQEIRRYYFLYFAQTIIKPWAEQSSFELCESRASNKEEDV